MAFVIMCKTSQKSKHSKDWYAVRGIKPFEEKLVGAYPAAVRKTYKEAEDWLRWDLSSHLEKRKNTIGEGWWRSPDSYENHVIMLKDDDLKADVVHERYYYITNVIDD